jgi:hypothetical protein
VALARLSFRTQLGNCPATAERDMSEGMIDVEGRLLGLSLH